MENLFYPVTVDILEKHLPPIVYVKQADTARGIAITLTARGEPYTIPAGGSYMLRVRKPDKTAAVLYAENKGNILYAELTEQALAVPGQGFAEAAIYAANGKIISSFVFGLHIEEAACTSDKISSSDDYDALARLLLEIAKTEAARAEAEAARATAEAGRQAAEAARASAENSRASAENTRQTQEAARQAAETARAEEYASFMETYGDAYKLMQEAAKSAAEIKDIYGKMQITLFYDETGGICYTENETKQGG